MEVLQQILNWLVGAWPMASILLQALGGIAAMLVGLVAVLRAIPGDQGEEKLQAIADFISRLIQGNQQIK